MYKKISFHLNRKMFLLIPLVITIFLFPSIKAWDNSSFPYEKDIQIQYDGSNTTLTNYQIELNVVKSNMKNDCTDLRFYEGSQLINDWIRSFTSTNCDVFIKVPSISNSVNTTVKMYYGNSTVEDISNPKGTMEIYDSFEDTTWSDNFWTYTWSNHAYTNGYLTTSDNNQQGCKNTTVFTNVSMEYTVKMNQNDNEDVYIYNKLNYVDPSNFINMQFISNNSDVGRVITLNPAINGNEYNNTQCCKSDFANNQWYTFRTSKWNDRIWIDYWDGSQWVFKLDSINPNFLTMSNGGIALGTWDNSVNKLWWDNITVYKRYFPEPVYTFESETVPPSTTSTSTSTSTSIVSSTSTTSSIASSTSTIASTSTSTTIFSDYVCVNDTLTKFSAYENCTGLSCTYFNRTTYENCQYGCDSVLNMCKPNPFLFLLVVFIIVIIIIIIIIKR